MGNQNGMDKIELIQQAIDNGINLKSKLDEDAFSVGSFTSPPIRHILNNLGAISNRHLEIGLHLCGTYIATNYKNNLESYGIDNWSQFCEDDRTKNEAIQNCKRLLKNNYTIIDKDCWQITNEIPDNIDLYTFDGGHNEASQHDAVTYYKKYLADECIMITDDASWSTVREGTARGIKDAGLEIVKDWFLWDGVESSPKFWNGLLITLLKKNNG